MILLKGYIVLKSETTHTMPVATQIEISQLMERREKTSFDPDLMEKQASFKLAGAAWESVVRRVYLGQTAAKISFSSQLHAQAFCFVKL